MLNPQYRYIGLDFETTGLDHNKDEPIQIGIVEIDHTGKTISTYQSLIKPQKDIGELKEMVSFITGLSWTDLEHAPSRAEILPNILPYFDENTVVIGHNIAFDLQFLRQVAPQISYHDSIDTFEISQQLVHFPPSYALEILCDHLKITENTETATFHDALYDTKQSIQLLLHLLRKLKTLAINYPIIHYLAHHHNFPLGAYIDGGTSPAERTCGEFDIPKLKKSIPNAKVLLPTTESIDTNSRKNQERQTIGQRTPKEFLSKIASNDKIILSFSSSQKLDIAKKILNELGIKHLGFLKPEYIIDYDLFKKFTQKNNFKPHEIRFIIKYYSHIQDGYSILDFNKKEEYHIYNIIKNPGKNTQYPIVLCTHGGLFAAMGKPEWKQYADYKVLFMDVEWRYKNYNNFLGGFYDPYHTMSILEGLIYKQEVQESINLPITQTAKDTLQKTYSGFQIFVAQFTMDCKDLFGNTSMDYLQTNHPISTNPVFFKTNQLWQNIKTQVEELSHHLETEDYEIVMHDINQLDHLQNSLLNLQRKNYPHQEPQFTMSESTQFTSRPEFLDIFNIPVYFCSHANPAKKPAISFVNTIKKIQEKITPEKNIFVVSTRKDESKLMFQELYKNNIHQTHDLFIENITGGMGKNIFKAKKSTQKIIIGGYAFLLAIYANHIALDEILVFNIRGSSEQLILDDILRYGT